jgi:hypothetical protein
MLLRDELIEIATAEGFLEDALPFIPELLIIRSDFTGKCFIEASKMFQSSIEILSISVAWSFYGGMGSVALWVRDWEELKSKGIYELLTREKGFKKLDEYVFFITALHFLPDEHKALIEFSKKLSYKALKYIADNFNKDDDKEKQLWMIQEVLNVMFEIGAGVQMNSIGMK